MLVTSSSCDKQKCLQILSNIPRGQNSSLVEDYWMDNLSFLFNFTSVHSFSHSFSSVHPFVLQVFSKNPCVLCTSSSRHSLLTQCLVISLGLQRQQSATNYKVLNVFFSPWFRVVQSFLCNKIMCTQFSNKKKAGQSADQFVQIISNPDNNPMKWELLYLSFKGAEARSKRF